MHEATPDDTLTIDVVSDAVCPWCFVGKRRLEAALAEFDAPVEIRWRPFQLDATIPQEGIDRADYLARKFGPERAHDMHARLKAVGDEAGIAFAFRRIARSPNTIDAHRLIRWAQTGGHQTDIVERLFNAYFIDGLDIGDRDVLARVAGECGLDAQDIRQRLDTTADVESVHEEIAVAQRLGVTGVPFFILGGKYALAGAQPPEQLVAAMRKALAAQADEAALQAPVR